MSSRICGQPSTPRRWSGRRSRPVFRRRDSGAGRDKPAARGTGRAGSSTELLEMVIGKSADAPLCFTCGTKMRPSGACYVCEGCGSTSGCS